MHRDFRNFLLGSFVSNVGGQVQTWAIAWHLYALTGNSLYVGGVGLVRVVPLLVLGLFGGVLADQFDRRSIVLWSQVFQALIAATLAVATLAGYAELWLLYAVVGLNAATQAFAGPARQAMVPGLVPARDFPNAASLNGMQWRLSEVLGPMISGLLIASGDSMNINGVGLCYTVNAVSFLAVMVAVWLIPKTMIDPSTRAKNPREVIASIAEGFRFVRDAPVLRNAMFIDFWGTFMAGANALFPAFAAEVLNLGPEGYGALASSVGAGALLASAALAWLPTIDRQGVWVIGMIAAFGIATVGFGLSPNLLMAGFFLAVTGASDLISTVLRQTIRQLATPDNMRGRMSSISMLFHTTGPQLGDFEAGAIGEYAGTRFSIVLGGVGSMGVAAWYWLRRTPLSRYRHRDVLASED